MADINPIGAILGGLGWLLGGLVSVGKQVANAISSVGLAVVTLARATATVFSRVGGYLANMGGFTRRLFTGIIPQMVGHLNEWLVKLAKHLHDWALPVVNAIKKARKVFIKQWNTFVRPVLDTIDVVRKTFRILGLLGIDSAKAVDRKLAQIEAKIEAPMFVIVGKLNEVLGWINRIVTVDGVLSELILITSLQRYTAAFKGYALHSVARPLSSEEQADFDARPAVKSPERNANDLAIAYTSDESYVRVLGATHAAELVALYDL